MAPVPNNPIVVQSPPTSQMKNSGSPFGFDDEDEEDEGVKVDSFDEEESIKFEDDDEEEEIFGDTKSTSSTAAEEEEEEKILSFATSSASSTYTKGMSPSSRSSPFPTTHRSPVKQFTVNGGEDEFDDWVGTSERPEPPKATNESVKMVLQRDFLLMLHYYSGQRFWLVIPRIPRPFSAIYGESALKQEMMAC